MINYFAYLREHTITVNVDPLLQPLMRDGINCDENNNVTLNFRLASLLYHVGTIQTKWNFPTKRNKYFDFSDLIEKINSDHLGLRLLLDHARENHGPEMITYISENLGIGISAVSIESIFNIQRNTISKITRSGKRPDWRCLTLDNQLLVVEAKGSTSQAYSNQQISQAIDQKANESDADIRIASASLILEYEDTKCQLIDPPANNLSMDENTILSIKADHYISVFRYLGNVRFVNYFEKLKKRLSSELNDVEYQGKMQILRFYEQSHNQVHYLGTTYCGEFENVKDNKYIFTGIDEQLLYISGFKNFIEYSSSDSTKESENYYHLSPDGVLIIEINNINSFNIGVPLAAIKNYQENVTLSDIDRMSPYTFTKLIIYFLEKQNLDVESSQRGIDIIVRNQAELIGIEIKHFKSPLQKRLSKVDYEQIAKYRTEFDRLILITNAPEPKIPNFDNFEIIDRLGLKRIIDGENLL